MRDLSSADVEEEICEAEIELRKVDMRAMRLWGKVLIPPVKWEQNQYPRDLEFLVVAVMGRLFKSG